MTPILETIRMLRDEKQNNNTVPDHVLLSELKTELLKQMRDELNQLREAGLIKSTQTINERAIILIE
ncbi:MAG: hypothetical protein IJ338_02250 [Bacteroidaceae bacterium]|nr:hypothetical protein [Bacteroidaceae bacterium]